ncbi:MAG: DUF29 domain-containing protein [Crocosphaera sp.]|nr:DUF29 domain-containing protein [Crocosphaera sp.]
MLKTDTQTKLQELYETDYHLWLEETIKLLKEKELNQIDLDHLIEELESLSRRDKAKVVSLLKRIIIHLLFLEFWTEEIKNNQNHWEAEIIAFRDQLNRLLTTNLKNYLESELEIVYQNSVKIAAKKMNYNINQFPEQCPYTLEQLLIDE